MTTKTTNFQRIMSLLLCVALLAAYLPASLVKSSAATESITTIADPETLTRPGTIYGDNTINTGKITVGKSVSDKGITVNGVNIPLTGDNNFLVTISQSAQVMGMTTQTSVPVDVVFVLDTSGSMSESDRETTMVTAVNSAIKTLMAANDDNRVGVVAFSDIDEGRFSTDPAAEVLSELKSYTGTAATNHLTWSGSNIVGQSGSRDGSNGGTNIQAGMVMGAQMLANADLTDGLARIPFLIILSDGAPTYNFSSATWYEPSMTGSQYGPGNDNGNLYAGNGFLPALVAAYYKGVITEHYFGAHASEDNRCNIYTLGVSIDNSSLAKLTMDPNGNFDANATYGHAGSFASYWKSYQAGSDFSISCGSRQNLTISKNSINATKNYVNGIASDGKTMYSGGIAYNDGYYSATDSDQIQSIFDQVVTEISKKAIASPTKVTTGDYNFDGYVNFYDPIGEYMEVKDMKGVLAGGYFYQGASFAKYLQAYGTSSANEEFDELLRSVLKTRMGLSSADDRFATEAELDAFIDELLTQARDSKNQANFTDNNNFDNSIVWWGNAYDSGEEDEHVQLIGFADNDSIDYITDDATVIPADADYVCRSYFFYGEAGGANTNPDHEYLYFVVRVQRELVAPYRETVVISAPASLLSVEKVLINESFDDNGNPVYTATVEHQEPARVVYEVGLWDEITPENVSYLISQEYANEYVNGAGSVNYDPTTDTYHFFTNDWDRSESLDSHHRGMAKATFDAASDNPFYTYQANTLIVDKDGKPVTADPKGTTAYYVREYYEWSDNKQDGTYTATKKTILIEVDIPSNAALVQSGGQWFIPKGAYTGATLVVNGDDTTKTSNETGTSAIVAHPHRTGTSENSHYTVLLGNNGKLSLKAEPYEPKKDVSITQPGGTVITDGDGKVVQVGDILTYTIEAKNILPHAADITVTDYIPQGTEFVSGSAGAGIVPDSNNVLTWTLKDVPAGETRTVSFQVKVTKAALSLNVVANAITNTAQVRIGNSAVVSTNTTTNPPYGKTVTGVNGADADGKGGYKVGDILVYHIRVANDTAAAANVTVTDVIPEGTVYVEGSADNGGVHANGTVTWEFPNMAPGTAKVVSFQVKITAAVQAENGEVVLENAADIQVGNNPKITTNTTVNKVDTGDMVITKLVAAGGDTTKSFTIRLGETSGTLNGTYTMLRDNAAETVTFVNGRADVTIRHGQTLTIQGLPAGTIINVAEDTSALPGWTPAYNTQSVTITKGAATTVSSVSITNTYKLQPLTVTVKGVKVMNGVTLPGSLTFGFVAQPDRSNPVAGDPLTGEVTVNGAGEFEFTMSSKTFTQPGVYKYTITEINGGVLGVNYDGTEHILVINVTDNGDGTMSAAATLNGTTFNLDTGAVTFTNTYVPAETQLQITADKTLNGRDLTAGEFSFQLTDGTNTYKGILGADGSIVFETMVFTQTGTYTYTMSEVIPGTGANGVSYDNKTYTVVVTVADVDGQLVPTVTVDGAAKTVTNGIVDTGITFVNTFTPDDVPLTLVANKTLMVYNPTNGQYENAAPEAGKFRFQVVDKATGKVVTTGSNAADGTITFNTFYFSADMLAGAASKDFTYVISEVVPELAKDPNMKYDLDGKEITVTLSKSGNGKLTVTVNGDSDGNVNLSSSVVFTNYSNPDSVEITPVGTKATTDAPEGVSFSFSVINTATGNEAAAGVGAANGAIEFSTMSFSEPGVYTYWIKEANAGNTTNGITYDKTLYLMKVEVSRDEYNRLVAEVTYWSSNVDGSTNVADYTAAATAPSFHNEYHAGGYINLTAKKVLNGRDLKAGEFAFKLIRQDNGGEIDGVLQSDGTIKFATMYYSGADIPAGQTSAVIHYVMSEVVPTNAKLPGVTYDTSEHDVYVRITDNGDGTISAVLVNADGTAISGTDTGVVFTNNYQAVQGDVIKYQIKKELNGRPIRAGEFEFGLYLNGQLEDVATNDANGIVTFSRTIPATAAAHAGIYKMVIKELPGTVPGVTYSTQEYTIYVKVTDDGAGSIIATVHLTEDGEALPEDATGLVDLTDRFVFTNTYAPDGTHYIPEAGKELTGRDLIAGEFSFQAQLISKDGTAVSDGSIYAGVNDANGKVLFERISYTEVGTYIYKITEIKGAISGVAYDESVYYLKVVVTDDGNGLLKAAASYFSDAACEKTADAIFRNGYTPSDASVQLEANKVLVGRDMIDKEFSFVVRKDNVDGDIVATGSNDATGKILFSTFNITAADMAGAKSKTFTYVILESENNIPGVTVDSSVITVTVTVTDDGTGALTATVNYPDNKPIVFTNTYKPNGAELPLVAFKELSGKNLAADEFIFQLKNAAGEVIQEVRNDADGVIAFQNLKFSAEDMVDADGNKVMEKVFVYTLSEKAGDDDRMTYDNTVYTITVTVTDDGKGNLTATMEVTDTKKESVEVLKFRNTYAPAALEVELEGVKIIVDAEGNVLNSGNYPLSGFEFQVYDLEGNLITTAESDAEGKIKFTGFKFTAAGEYRFLINEKLSAKPGYTTDPTVWCVHITVGYDADEGKLFEAGEYVHVAPEVHDEISAHVSQTLEFINVYKPADAELVLQGVKVLDGRQLREHEFTFYMVDKATNLRAAESRNHGDGKINFHLTYTKAGTYTYTVYEEIPADENKLGGILYDNTTYEVTVTVTDDGSGKLNANVTQIKNLNDPDDTGATVQFNNQYKPGAAQATVEAWKYLDGRDLRSKEFTFELVNKADSDERYTTTNKLDGHVLFETLSFEKAGVYEYILREVEGKVPGVTYDDTSYTVTITVTDDGNGQLSAAVTHDGQQAMPIFRNTYEAADVTYTPEVQKIYEGGDMLTFDFILSGEGFATQIKQNNAAGEVTFDALTFTAAGEYTFTISEKVNEQLEDIKWDTNVYTLTIQVKDNGEGQLVIEQVSITSDLGRNDLVFRNVHEDLIAKKDVFLKGNTAISIDGMAVEKGDVLTYTVTYKNYTGKPIDIIITDLIPAHTTYVEGSANYDGVYADGKLTWKIAAVEPDATITVRFDVVVTDGEAVVNQAQVLEGENTYKTNIISNSVREDIVVKDVFQANEPTISIDGKNVKQGDTLLYKITYTNSDDFEADVILTDTIPAYAAYVDGSADNGGVYADGVITWNVHLKAGQSVTVTFQVKVIGTNIAISNQATAIEGENQLKTNVVTNPVPEDTFEKDAYTVTKPNISVDGKYVQLGDILVYTLTYTNSFEAAADVTLIDIVPQYTTYVTDSADNGGVYADGVITWNVRLEANESITVSFKVIVADSNVIVSNQAIALEGENELKTNAVQIQVPEDKIYKDVQLASKPNVSIDGQKVQIGDILQYTITYVNSFEAPADVIIVDEIPQHTTYVAGSADNGGVYSDGKLIWKLHLVAGDSVTVTFQVKVDATNVTIVNQAIAMEGENEVKTNIVTNPVPEDSFVKDAFEIKDPTVSVDGKSVKHGDTLVYRLTYMNSFEAPADVVITDIIPQHTTYVEGSADHGGVYADGKLMWKVRLEAGEKITVSFRVTVTGSNVTVSNQATAMEGENVLKSNAIQIQVPEDHVYKDVVSVLDPAVSIDGQKVKPGDILLYKITYVNSYEAAADVVITDVIPDYATYVDGSADNGGVHGGGKLTWNVHLEAGESITVTFQVKVVGSNVSIVNQATATEGENELKTNVVTNLVPEDTFVKDVFHAQKPAISINGQKVQVGDTLVYKITYTNSYEAAADVTITDRIPEHTVYVDGSADNGGIYADGVITWNAHLEAGESITVTFQVKVAQANVNVVNQATAIEGENKLETNTAINPVPEDTFEKEVVQNTEPTVSVDGKPVKLGDILTYKLTYTNSFEAAADVVITDYIPKYTAYVEGSADNGGVYADGVITWNVHLEAGESITVTFQVKVKASNVTISNQAAALEGENKLESNSTETLVPEDIFEKDVALAGKPDVSIDGQTVHMGDILQYTITYTNSFEAAADVIITDLIPQNTIYVDGSANYGGVYADGKLTWNVHLEAGESITVTFQVKVKATNVTIANQAVAVEGENQLQTNRVETPVRDSAIPETGDNSMIWLYALVLVVSGGAIITLVITNKKRRFAE